MELRTPNDLGAFVRDARRGAGLTQETLAARAGVTRRWLSSLESGKSGVELGLVLATMRALGVVLEAHRPAEHPATSAESGAGPVDLDAFLSDYLTREGS